MILFEINFKPLKNILQKQSQNYEIPKVSKLTQEQRGMEVARVWRDHREGAVKWL